MAVNEKSLKNLNPIKKGEVRNRKGRGKNNKNLKTIIREFGNVHLGKKHPNTGQELTYLEAAILTALTKAVKGDVNALEKMMDRLEGKPVQATVSATATDNDIDVSKLSSKELETLNKILTKASKDNVDS